MGNNFFRFKQFTIYQEKSAMKVGTDGVLLGAWTDCANVQNVLDIGTGTGLVAIMIAQRCGAKIEAVEIDQNSFVQAVENISICPWASRITAHRLPIQDYAQLTEKKYDLIISNPPFFSNSLKPKQEGKTISRHTDLLSFHDLIRAVKLLLTDNGVFSVILPYTEGLQFIGLCHESSLFCSRKTIVLPCPWKSPSRLLLEFCNKEQSLIEAFITIELTTRHEYSPEYINLTKDFYL